MLASTPEPPYVAVIFSSVRTDEDDVGYNKMADEMEALALEQPGYLGIESARSPDGQGITVSYWRTIEDAKNWGAVTDHAYAQRLGRMKWYRSYRVRVTEVLRKSDFAR